MGKQDMPGMTSKRGSAGLEACALQQAADKVSARLRLDVKCTLGASHVVGEDKIFKRQRVILLSFGA